MRGSAAAPAPSHRQRRVLLGRRPCSPPGASPGKVVSRLPRALHPRAGGPRRVSPGPLLLPASLSLAACAGRPGRRRKERRWQGPSRCCLSCLPRQWRPKVSLCPRDRVPWLALPMAHAAGPGRERGGGGDGSSVPSPSRGSECRVRPRSSSLSLLFLSTPCSFFPQG